MILGARIENLRLQEGCSVTLPPKARSTTIDGRARTVRELLDKAKYAIDFYQREYAWKERQVRGTD